MSDPVAQNFSNHSRFPTAFVVVALLGLIAAVGLAVGFVMRSADWAPTVSGVSTILLGVTVLVGHSLSRPPLLTLQDRIIRLESEVRCERLLTDDLKEKARGLSLKQRIATRFASDEEFPGLVRRVIEENIQDGKAIKQLVKDWQADHQRV